MRISNRRYWAFQFFGWSLWVLINFFFAITLKRFNEPLLLRIIFYMEMGIIITHLMREVIHRTGVLRKKVRQQIVAFAVLTFGFSILYTCIITPYESVYIPQQDSEGNQISYFSLLIRNLIQLSPLILFWNAFYFIYHFNVKMQKQELDTIKLEALVKQLELQTIKAHINPHFIFNALNGIRALIDENPQRARRAITELSNILRSSLSAEKSETVTFEKELKIVKDYLELESMRFEDRLKVEFDVAEETLARQVPPMMLQTLVENAIKHGISKQVQGGTIRIKSDVNSDYHELVVQNTGHLNGFRSSTGFGLSSTRDRLDLLYGSKALFEIKQVDPTVVEARVLLPVKNSVKD